MEAKKYTKYEKARIIGSRALQISQGAAFLIKLSEEDLERIKFNPVEIAKMEYEQGLIPIEVKTPFPKSRLKEGKVDLPKPVAPVEDAGEQAKE